jgi:hypothetical protein
VKGILADVNIRGHFALLQGLMEAASRKEIWTHLALSCPTFGELGLHSGSSDLLIWEKCQAEELVLVTANRNDDGPDSLQTTIASRNSPDCLPVITLADPDRILKEKPYSNIVADRLLEYLFDIDQYKGTGRLFVP